MQYNSQSWFKKESYRKKGLFVRIFALVNTDNQYTTAVATNFSIFKYQNQLNNKGFLYFSTPLISYSSPIFLLQIIEKHMKGTVVKTMEYFIEFVKLICLKNTQADISLMHCKLYDLDMHNKVNT